MAAGWTPRRLLVLGLPVLIAGFAILWWESVQETDVELLSAPLLLLGAFLLFEAYLAWRRSRLPGNNAK